ncbi:PTS sugar transporter subunit IIA [Streptobacillus felis]|uniref:PTS sugar transporter subunit IIA n=1 Tax=Streptobacillus felis TaxID=1384509 RepID=A0A7Z0T6R1_9FUSO|nr:PTS sugar transporter subunit IIA [Streptobacillus felis]NYV27486.1 PTS sugar transporter subunit IIA [Streptobacillus felis]
MKISEIIKLENISLDLKGNTKKEILEELSNLVKSGEITNQEDFLKDLINRENAGSTALEHGLAIPHVRSKNIEHFTIALGIKKEGVDFESIDGEKTKLFVLIATPERYNNWHLEALVKISRMFYNPINVSVLVHSKSKEGVQRLIEQLEGMN